MNKWALGNFLSLARLLDDSYVKESRLARLTFFKEPFATPDLAETESRLEV